jgi:hypothetical protein
MKIGLSNYHGNNYNMFPKINSSHADVALMPLKQNRIPLHNSPTAKNGNITFRGKIDTVYQNIALHR